MNASQKIFSFTVFALIFGLSLPPLGWSKSSLRASHNKADAALEAELEEPLYLPDAKYVRLVTLGFDNFAADILWFQTVNYFGKRFIGGKDYRWLSQMCELVVHLNPNAEHVYEFCSTLLAWMAKDPVASNRMLNMAIEHDPTRWRNFYLRGFNYWYFLNDKANASKDMAHAAKLPAAPAFVASLASKLLVDAGDPRNAVAFLTDALRNTKDQTAKKALSEKLVAAKIAVDVNILDQAIKDVEEQTNQRITSLEQLVKIGKLRFVPKDPAGKPYKLDLKTGYVTTQGGERGLVFTGKTAETGLLSNDFKETK